MRSTTEVFEAHLECRKLGDVERDIRENYAADVILLTLTGVYRGHDGVRHTASQLQRYLPDGAFEYRIKHVLGEYAYLNWHGTSPEGEVRDGADGFHIREGRIVAQTIHYTIEKKRDQRP